MAAADDLKAILDYYGLGALFDRLNQVIIDDPTLVRQPVFLLNSIRDTDTYKNRFKGNEIRRAKGYAELSPADYVAAEEGFRATLRANSMPKGFYDSQEDFNTFIGNDVRPDELNTRISKGFTAVMDAEPGTKAELQRLYGLNEADIAAFFIDPERFQQSEAVRKAEAAKIASEARRQAGIELQTQQAEALAQEGFGRAEAQQGFGQIGTEQELFRTTAAEQAVGEKSLTTEQQIAGTFGTNAEARKAIEERRRRRKAAFEAGGGLAETAQGITGLRTVGQ